MRSVKIENYYNPKTIERKKISDIPKISRYKILMNEKDKIKLIKTIERTVRSSQEYKHYIQFLKEEIDMTQCSFFNNISNKDSKKVSIEIHHEPFTLFDMTQTVMNKWIAEERDINPIMMAEDVMKIHYQGHVGLIPLSLTVHELCHTGKIFIPLQDVYGDFISFLEEYDDYIPADLKDILQAKLKMSKELQFLDMTILDKHYIYLEVDGMTFPQPIPELVNA